MQSTGISNWISAVSTVLIPGQLIRCAKYRKIPFQPVFCRFRPLGSSGLLGFCHCNPLFPVLYTPPCIHLGSPMSPVFLMLLDGSFTSFLRLSRITAQGAPRESLVLRSTSHCLSCATVCKVQKIPFQPVFPTAFRLQSPVFAGIYKS